MSIYSTVKVLEALQKQDKAFIEGKTVDRYATWCPECGQNTFIGRYPFWHRYSRDLCSRCGKDYIQLLKSLNALN